MTTTTTPPARPEARNARIFTEGATFAERAAQRRAWLAERDLDPDAVQLVFLSWSEYIQRDPRTHKEQLVKVALYADRHDLSDVYVVFPNGSRWRIRNNTTNTDSAEPLGTITPSARPPSTFTPSQPDPAPQSQWDDNELRWI